MNPKMIISMNNFLRKSALKEFFAIKKEEYQEGTVKKDELFDINLDLIEDLIGEKKVKEDAKKPHLKIAIKNIQMSKIDNYADIAYEKFKEQLDNLKSQYVGPVLDFSVIKLSEAKIKYSELHTEYIELLNELEIAMIEEDNLEANKIIRYMMPFAEELRMIQGYIEAYEKMQLELCLKGGFSNDFNNNDVDSKKLS